MVSMIKKIKAYRDRDKAKLYITAQRDWSMVVIAVFVMLVAVFSYNYYIYVDKVMYGEGGEFLSSKDQKDSEVMQFKQELDETLLYFEQKKAHHEDLLEKPVDFMMLVENTVPQEASEDEEEVATSSEEEVVSMKDIMQEGIENAGAVWEAFVDLFR